MVFICKQCGKEHRRRWSTKGLFCSSECANKFKSLKARQLWIEHKKPLLDRKCIRKHLTEMRGYKCEVCGLSE